MKQGWEIKKMHDVVDFQRGLTYSKNDEVAFSDNIVLRSNNVDLKTNMLDFTELKYINPKFFIPENKKVTKGSLIICTANGSKSHLGKVALIDDDYNYAFGGFMGLIKPKENLNPDFLFHLMTSEGYKKFIGALSDGANINNLKFGDLGEFEIPLPPLPEQLRIVSILDEAFTTIAKAKANAEQNLKNAKELFESYLEGMFEKEKEGWEATSLMDEVDLVVGFAFKSKEYTENINDILLLRGDNIMQGNLRLTDVRRWKKSEYDDYKKYQLKQNDIVLAMDRPWVKAGLKIARLSINDLPALLVQRTACLRTRATIDNSFLYHLLKSKSFINYLSDVQTGIGVPHISGQQILEYTFNKPSLIVQRMIVQKLDALITETQKLEVIYENKINALEELKKSILQKAFSGELENVKEVIA